MMLKNSNNLIRSLPSYRRLSRFSALNHRRAITCSTASTPAPQSATTSTPYWLWVVSGIAIAAVFEENGSGSSTLAHCEHRHKGTGIEYESGQIITNWSNTHQCNPTHLYEPKSSQEVLRLLQYLHRKGWEKARPIGTALSPNGIGMSDQSLISMHSLDYVEVDPENRLVTVGAGVRVSEVLKALEKHNLTLQNFSSIQEQQLAGWTQVAAHGTGCTLPTVDEMIVRMKLATATEGLMTLSQQSNPALFSMAKVGLGALGVVTELTLQCVPKHTLLEHTFTLPLKDIGKDHLQRLKEYRHVRYMWLPYTTEVVVVVSNPTGDGVERNDPAKAIVENWEKSAISSSQDLPTKPLYELLLKCEKDSQSSQQTQQERELSVKQLSFSQLRDRLLDFAPLDLKHIQAVNQAESEFWKRCTGSRQDDSTKILGFDCGGEQFVFEVCFPIGPVLKDSVTKGSSKDIEFVQKLMKLIEKHQIPAHCPIEQRWTARSTAKMSPAYSQDPDEVFSWVGIIMYLPPHQIPLEREEITKQFQRYTQLIQPLLEEYNAHCHWAKIELPKDYENSNTPNSQAVGKSETNTSSWWSRIFGSSSNTDVLVMDERTRLRIMKERIKAKFPVEEFNAYRKVLDPKGILSNKLIDSLFNDN